MISRSTKMSGNVSEGDVAQIPMKELHLSKGDVKALILVVVENIKDPRNWIN